MYLKTDNIQAKGVPKDHAITITFDHHAKVCSDNILTNDLNNHGGGRTNITEAFQLMDRLIEEIDKKEMITILFISDGKDNNPSTLNARLKTLKGNQGHTINFICLGIKKAFPTFLSMYLREIYHNGLPSIPALYLIEYYSTAAITNKFLSMKENFSDRKSVV